MNSRRQQLDHDQAESIAIGALQHIAGDPQLLQRFVALSGIDPQDLREAAASSDFLSGVLDFFMGDEAALQTLAAALGEDPGTIAVARSVLSAEAAGDWGEQ